MHHRLFLSLTRIGLGWLMFYAGITKVLNPNWTAAGFLSHAKSLPWFYSNLADPAWLPVVNFANEWGLTLLGVSLILGLGVRLSSVLGAILMVLYYIPNLDFPYVGSTSYIVDDHIVYALLLLHFAAVKAGRGLGLDNWFASRFLSKHPTLQQYFG